MNSLQVKICGIRSINSAFAATKGAASHIGFNFVPSSKRLIEADVAKTIVRAIKENYPDINTPKPVGVFANQPLLYVNSVAEYCELDMVQLSGEEPLAFAEKIISPTLKAIKVDTSAPRESELRRLDQLAKLAKRLNVEVILDKYDPHLQGGTGQTHDWQLAAKLAEHHSFLLSGGLHSGNIQSAISSVRPLGVDVASGIETDGKDDANKIGRFITDAQAAHVQIYN